MARNKQLPQKLRLAKAKQHTKWAPFWTVPRIYGKTRRVHPGRHTTIKRNWRKTNIEI